MELACSPDGSGGVPILAQIEFAQIEFKVCTGVHSGPKGPVIDITSSFCGWAPGPLGNVFRPCAELACSPDGSGGVPILVQIEFKVCTGVHSGPKGPVIDITSSFCGWAPGPLGNVLNANKI